MKKICLFIWLLCLFGCGAQTPRQSLPQASEADWTAVIQQINTLPAGYEDCRPELREDPPSSAWPAEKIEAHIQTLKAQGEILSETNENILRQQLNRLKQPSWTEYRLNTSNCGFQLDDIEKATYYVMHQDDLAPKPLAVYLKAYALKIDTDAHPMTPRPLSRMFVAWPDLQLWWQIQAQSVYVYTDLKLTNGKQYRSDTFRQSIPEQYQNTLSFEAYERIFRPECPQDEPVASCPYPPYFHEGIGLDKCSIEMPCVTAVEDSPPRMRSPREFRMDPRYSQCFYTAACVITKQMQLILIDELHKYPEHQYVLEFKLRKTIYDTVLDAPIVELGRLPEYMREALAHPVDSAPQPAADVEKLIWPQGRPKFQQNEN